MLTEQQISELASSRFTWWQGTNKQVRVPILNKSDDGRWRIRFNQATLMREMNASDFAKSPVLQSLI
ncbi:unnamed protein product, partial [Rotaria magnacalcarata]